VIAAKRAALLLARRQFDEAAALCRKMLEDIGDGPHPDVKMFAYKTLADIELQRERYSEAEEPYRSAIAIAREKFPPRVPVIELGLADVLLQLGRDAEVAVLLREIGQSSALNPPEHVRLLRLSARAAENRGELREALNCEREASAIEREILERNAEQSLRNARIIAETDLREREADLERERRRRVERELAEAVVELGDRKRLVDTVELRLRGALEKTGAGQDKMVTKALRETLAELRAGACAPESPLRYLNGVDDDFYRRLRQSYPDLTSKQERLCGLLRAGLSSREIGTLMGLEAEGLKAQRKRLRKRMGLHPQEKLETLLATV
jgi:DNA-binding NarL/FixJ family response regulator